MEHIRVFHTTVNWNVGHNYSHNNQTLFLDGPSMPGGSCSLCVQVTPLSYDRFMQPLHLDFTKPTVRRRQENAANDSFMMICAVEY